MKHVRIKIGDLFRVTLNNGESQFFQYVGNDKTQLNGDVVRISDSRYSTEDNPRPEILVKDKIGCYALTLLRWGVYCDNWTKYGHSDDVGSPSKIRFRINGEGGILPGWKVWRINRRKRWYFGLLLPWHRRLDEGCVHGPLALIYILDYHVLHGTYHIPDSQQK